MVELSIKYWWLEASFRTEFHIKTGIVLLGAILPLIFAAYWTALH